MRRWSGWLAVLVMLAWMRPLDATVLVPADFATMVSESQVIVHGRVADVRGALVGSRRSIESLVTVEVLTSIKGQTGRELMFRVPGGRVGRYRRVFVGAPTFTPGQEVVIFLTGRGPTIPMPFGLSQGVYRVSRTGGSPVVIPIPPTDGVAGIVRGDPARKALSLDEFTRQVRVLTQNAR